MLRHTIRLAIGAAVALIAAAPLGAQQRVARFADASAAIELSTPDALVSERSTYWLEGTLIGAAAGIVYGVLTIDNAEMCPAQPGASCNEDPMPVVIGSALLGVAGAALGLIVGSSVARGGHGG